MTDERSLKAIDERGRRQVAVPVALLALLWFGMLTVGAGDVDGRLLAALYAGDNAAVTAVARAFTFFGDAPVLIAISMMAALWLFYRGWWRQGAAVLLVTLVGRALVSAQKYGISRLRPEDQVHLVPVSNPSFPSGHAASSMIVYLTLALVLTANGPWNRAAIAAALAFSLCIGLSRVILGVHWPSDVVGGWAFGLLWVMVALPLAERLTHPLEPWKR